MMRRALSCNVFIDRLDACTGRRTAALRGKAPVPGIEDGSRNFGKDFVPPKNVRYQFKETAIAEQVLGEVGKIKDSLDRTKLSAGLPTASLGGERSAARMRKKVHHLA